MSKIDFQKVEEKLMNAMRAMFVKKIEQGKSIVSPQAVRFYRLNDPRPKTEDPIFKMIDEIREEEQQSEIVETNENESPTTVSESSLHAETNPEIQEYKFEGELQEKEETPTPVQEEDEDIDPETMTPKKYLFAILKQHIAWLRKKKVKDLNIKLGTTLSEVQEIEHKEDISEEEIKRLKDIIQKALDVKRQTMKELGIDSDEVVIEKQMKKHRNKRFNIRDDWLPLH